MDCVSVIIPTKDSAKTIKKCLQSVRAQSYRNTEIFIVDGFSSDKTIEIASGFSDSIFSVDGERAKAKNFGILKSTCEFLLFIDSDMILQPTVIEECVRLCSDDYGIAGVIIPERSIGNSFWVKVRDFERSIYVGSKIESARFFRSRYVTEVGGFDEDIVFYEESTLPKKIVDVGMNVDARISSYIFNNEEEFDLSKWLYKKRYYSKSTKYYHKKYGKYAKLKTSIYYRISVLTGRGNWKKLVRHPLLTAGVIILKTLEFLASRI